MPAILVPTETESKPKSGHGIGGPPDNRNGGDGPERWGNWDSNYFGGRPDLYKMGMWLGLASILMMFVGFSSAYIFGQGSHSQWRPLNVPPFLWPNSLMLLASSVTLELAKRQFSRGHTVYQRWLVLTVILGVAFLGGQLWVWKALVEQGIYLSGNPHSSFFYLLTGTHGLHLLGGLLALGYVMARTWRVSREKSRVVLDVTAIYWHFMDGLWIYLFFLLFLWR